MWLWLLIAVMKGAQKECTFLKYFHSFSAAWLNNIESEGKVFAQKSSYEESDYGDSDDEDIEQLHSWHVK